MICWLAALLYVSNFDFKPFNIHTTNFIYLVINAIFIFDCLLMQLLSGLLGKSANKPIFQQFGIVTTKIDEGFVVYNDIPVGSVAFPLFKIIFG